MLAIAEDETAASAVRGLHEEARALCPQGSLKVDEFLFELAMIQAELVGKLIEPRLVRPKACFELMSECGLRLRRRRR